MPGKHIVIGERYLFAPEFKKNDLDSAYQYFSKALQLATVAGSGKWKHESLYALGKYYFSVNESAKAKACFHSIINDFHQAGDSAAEAHAWSQLGNNTPDSDNSLNEKIVVLEKSMRMYHVLKDTNNERSELEDITRANMYQANFAIAKKQFLRAAELRKAVGNKTIYKDYQFLAWIAHAMGNLDEALLYALATERDMKSLNITDNIGMAPLIAQIYSDNGQPEKSIESFRSMPAHNKHWNYFTCGKVAEQYIILGRPDSALSYVNEIETKGLPETPADKEGLAAAKGDCYAALNKPALAKKYYPEMIQLDNEAM